MERETFYLDGPNDFDWIFRNNVIDERETRLYVDHVADTDGHRWSDPSMLEIGRLVPKPHAIGTAIHFHDARLLTAEALAAIADFWRVVEITSDTHFSEIEYANRSTLEHLKSRGLFQEKRSLAYSWLIQEWQFPMYNLDLSPVKVELEELRKQQRNRHRNR